MLRAVFCIVFLGMCGLAPLQSQSTETDFGPFDADLIPVESQAWFLPHGHLHMSMRYPLGQTKTTPFPVEVRLVLHHNPATLRKLTAQWNGHPKYQTLSLPGQGCGLTDTCAWVETLTVDPTEASPPGWHAFRPYLETFDSSAGKFWSSLFLPLLTTTSPNPFVGNHAGAPDQMGSIGWNGTASGHYLRTLWRDIPLAPVSGTVTFRISAHDPEHERLVIDLDKTHHIPAVGSWPEQLASPGLTIFDVADAGNKIHKIELDTTILRNGWHSLAARNELPPDANGNIEAGVGKFWFYVDNEP